MFQNLRAPIHILGKFVNQDKHSSKHTSFVDGKGVSAGMLYLVYSEFQTKIRQIMSMNPKKHSMK